MLVACGILSGERKRLGKDMGWAEGDAGRRRRDWELEEVEK